MRLPDRLQLPFKFDPERMERDLRDLSAATWIKHYVRRNYDGDWSIIPLRGRSGARHPVMMIYADPQCRDFEDTPMLDACPYLRQVLTTFKAPLQTVRLMRLAPASLIKEHTDHDLSFEDGTVRIHIPVMTNPEVEFQLNGSRVILEVGTSWYLRLSDPHSVANKGATDRVHMVVDVEVNDWLSDVFKTAAALNLA